LIQDPFFLIGGVGKRMKTGHNELWDKQSLWFLVVFSYTYFFFFGSLIRWNIKRTWAVSLLLLFPPQNEGKGVQRKGTPKKGQNICQKTKYNNVETEFQHYCIRVESIPACNIDYLVIFMLCILLHYLFHAPGYHLTGWS